MRTTSLQEKKRKRDEELIIDGMKDLIITKKIGKVACEQLPDIKTILYKDPPTIIPKSNLNPEHSQLILFSPQKLLVSKAEESKGKQRVQERTQRKGITEKIMPMPLDAGIVDFWNNPSPKRQKDNSDMSMELD